MIWRGLSLAAWSDALASLEVIGVVGNVRYGAVEEPFAPQVYLSLLQNPVPFGYLFLRADGDAATLAAALRREAAAVDRNVPVYDVRTMSQRLAAVTSRPRFTATLLGLFAAAALALAAAGESTRTVLSSSSVPVHLRSFAADFWRLGVLCVSAVKQLPVLLQHGQDGGELFTDIPQR